MNREQAIEVLISRYNSGVSEEIAIGVALAVLRGPVPDPSTGLLPCGCGGKAIIWPSDLRQAMVTAYQVACTECAMTTGWVRGKQENAIKVWNTAMGRKGGAEEVGRL